MQQTAFSTGLQLLAEIAHVHLHNIAAGTLPLPHLLKQQLAAQHLAAPPQEHLQQHEFPGRQRHHTVSPPHRSVGGIDTEIVQLKQRRSLPRALLNRAVQAQTQQQIAGPDLREPEIIGTASQAGGASLNAVAFQIQQDRHGPETAAQVLNQCGLIGRQHSGHWRFTRFRGMGRGPGTEPVEGGVARCSQTGRQRHRRRACQQQQGISVHSRSGLAMWGRPQPNLLRSTWKNSWSARRTKRTG